VAIKLYKLIVNGKVVLVKATLVQVIEAAEEYATHGEVKEIFIRQES